jgi:hypothetical protein
MGGLPSHRDLLLCGQAKTILFWKMEMEIKEFTFRLMLLGTPGIACYFLLRKLIGKIGSDAIELFLSIFLLAILCYLAADIFFIGWHGIPHVPWHENYSGFSLIRTIFSDTPKIEDSAVLKTTIFAIPVAGIVSLAYKRKWWNRSCQKLKLTNRFGDEDIFNYLLDGGPDTGRWYTVRDHKEGLIYYGAITLWSDEREDREMILTDVDVYSNVGIASYLYSCASLYVCRNRDDLSIELDPTRKPDKNTRHEREA